jgi:hypothetical protein
MPSSSYRPIHFPIQHPPPIMRFKSLPHFSSSLVTILPYLDCYSKNIMNFLQISSLVANLPTTIIYESPIVFHPNQNVIWWLYLLKSLHSQGWIELLHSKFDAKIFSKMFGELASNSLTISTHVLLIPYIQMQEPRAYLSFLLHTPL